MRVRWSANAKGWCVAAFTVILFGTLIFGADRLLTLKSAHGIRQTDCFYSQPRNSIDVAFMGSSHIHCNVNTAQLWEKYGIASYDYSAAEQPLWLTYYYLLELCKRQTPRVVVIDLYSPARFKDDYQYDWLEDNLLGVRFSLNKVRMLQASCEPERYFDFAPDWMRYHNRYAELTADDVTGMFESTQSKSAFKGYTPYFQTQEQIEPVLTQEDSGGLTVKSEMYLQKIIEYAVAHDIELFFIVSPYMTTSEDELVYNRVHEISDYYGIEFISTNYFYNEMDIDFEKDFADPSHLNYRGSCKFSDYIGGHLKQKFDIPDRRGDAYWESWDRHVQDINEQVKSNEGE